VFRGGKKGFASPNQPKKIKMNQYNLGQLKILNLTSALAVNRVGNVMNIPDDLVRFIMEFVKWNCKERIQKFYKSEVNIMFLTGMECWQKEIADDEELGYENPFTPDENRGPSLFNCLNQSDDWVSEGFDENGDIDWEIVMDDDWNSSCHMAGIMTNLEGELW
jgi:hypothetical protein